MKTMFPFSYCFQKEPAREHYPGVYVKDVNDMSDLFNLFLDSIIPEYRCQEGVSSNDYLDCYC